MLFIITDFDSIKKNTAQAPETSAVFLDAAKLQMAPQLLIVNASYCKFSVY